MGTDSDTSLWFKRHSVQEQVLVIQVRTNESDGIIRYSLPTSYLIPLVLLKVVLFYLAELGQSPGMVNLLFTSNIPEPHFSSLALHIFTRTLAPKDSARSKEDEARLSICMETGCQVSRSINDEMHQGAY